MDPVDLDYRALSNAGAWRVERLQTYADGEPTDSAALADVHLAFERVTASP
jgi:hypothetical protein